MSTVTPTATDVRRRQSGDATADLSVDALKAGDRILGHFRIEEVLDRRESWGIFLADNEERSELVLLVLAASPETLAECLSGPASGTIVAQTPLGSWRVAEVALAESHFQHFATKLLGPPRPFTQPTAPSSRDYGERRLEDGSLFVGRYGIEGILGRGGMGEVYRARDNTLRRAVALKVVRVDTTQGTPGRYEAKRRLLKEARVVSALEHPHIVELYDAGESEGLPYLVLELCDGGNLRHAMTGYATESERFRWLTEMAEALAYAHEQGIVHRDVKPENVLLTDDRTVKVADFGIAKALRNGRVHDDTTLGIVGTPRYMAPEQLLGHKVDARVDQFAWGLVAYELLTGVHPRATDLAILRAGDSATIAPSVPAHLRRVLARAMESEPGERYANFRELLADLHQPRRSKGRRRLPIAMAAVLAAIAAAAGYSATRSAPADTRGKIATRSGTSPLGASSNAEAESLAAADGLLEQGIQLWSDGAGNAARRLFAQVAERDPNNALAHLLCLASTERIQAADHEYARIALTLRSHLRESDALLLEALRPLVDEPADVQATTRRIEELATRYPDDRLVRLAHAQHYMRSREPQRALALASTLGNSPERFWLGAAAELQLGHIIEGRKLLEQCIDVSPGATDCLEWFITLEANDGRCEIAERAARRLIAKDSKNVSGYTMLANAVLAQTHSTAAARGILQARIERSPPDQRRETEAAWEFLMHLYDGDFDAASRDMDSWQSATTSSDAFQRGLPFAYRIELELELGRNDDARRTAREFAYRSEAWLVQDNWDGPIESIRALYFTSEISRSEFRAARETAVVKQIARGGGFYSIPAIRWFDDYVQTARDKVDAIEAVAARPPDSVIDPLYTYAGVDAWLGRAYLLAGHLDQALPLLKRAASSCTILKKPHDYIHGLLWLGDALEQKGDHREACNAYAKVIERWGREPRSITARQARAKLASCPPPSSHIQTDALQAKLNEPSQ